MSSRIETGACFCGSIAAELHGEPFWICYDHDDECRRAIGGPLNVWVGYRPEQFHLTRGSPKSFSKTRGIVRTFCGDCGTSIGYIDKGLSDELYLAIGFLDNPDRFQPQAHAYWRMKLPWGEFRRRSASRGSLFPGARPGFRRPDGSLGPDRANS